MGANYRKDDYVMLDRHTDGSVWRVVKPLASGYAWITKDGENRRVHASRLSYVY